MGIFEVLTSASVALGLAIPVFMEKVMRPRYEEQFEQYRKDSRTAFVDELDEAVGQLRQSADSLSPETVEKMESLFSTWGEIKSNENRLDILLTRRAS